MSESSSHLPSIAVVGSGVSGLSAAWLMSRNARVTLYEKDGRLGGHAHTVSLPGLPAVDTGFIVYNALNYPNLVAMFDQLQVPTKETDMSFAVSLDAGRTEYGGVGAAPIIGRLTNLLRPRFWRMLADLTRFYRDAPGHADACEEPLVTLGEYLERNGYSEAFLEDHRLPLAAAIWSAPTAEIRAFPAAAFIRFFENHGLLKLAGRPMWRTVIGGSQAYVSRLLSDYQGEIRSNCAVTQIRRLADGVEITDAHGDTRHYDRVVIATHGDQALKLLADPSPEEQRLLSAFRYSRNLAVLHSDRALMPKRKITWSSWNFVGRRGNGPDQDLCVTYWMNLLQGLPGPRELFLTLNPITPPAQDQVMHTQVYEHPIFDAPAIRAQREVWKLQGTRHTYFCGAHFGSGFHEDGLQAGLAAAELAADVRRPWSVEGESNRIVLAPRIEKAA